MGKSTIERRYSTIARRPGYDYDRKPAPVLILKRPKALPIKEEPVAAYFPKPAERERKPLLSIHI